MPTILISGANGFIAKNCIDYFEQHDYSILRVSHLQQDGHYTLAELEAQPDLLTQIQVVLNLAGANIGEKRWSHSRKQLLITSRLNTTHKLVKLFNHYNPKAHFISISAVGIYPLHTDCSENTLLDYQHYASFSEQITKQWEQAASAYQGPLTISRLGVVLASTGGAFPRMLRPFLMGAGGHLGHGQQYFPWIALPDVLSALKLIIEQKATGIYNLVAPELISNHKLSEQIAQIWQRPFWLHLPGWLVKLIFGQMGQELFLSDLRVLPTRLKDQQFEYHYPTLKQCLTAIKHQLF